MSKIIGKIEDQKSYDDQANVTLAALHLVLVVHVVSFVSYFYVVNYNLTRHWTQIITCLRDEEHCLCVVNLVQELHFSIDFITLFSVDTSANINQLHFTNNLQQFRKNDLMVYTSKKLTTQLPESINQRNSY